MTSALDKQVGGSHYKKHAIQPIEFIHANGKRSHILAFMRLSDIINTKPTRLLSWLRKKAKAAKGLRAANR